jgi:succinate dehydrogenase / fumarate reductase cytochrome b subunit
MANTKRPLSPHLQVYRPQITSMLSILHRITGVALAVGTLLFSYWLISATYGPEKFATAQSVMGSWFGQLVLWGFTFTLFYHLGNGVRHLAWDAGLGFDLDKLRVSGWLVVLFAAAMTVLTLVIAYAAGG